MDVGEDRAIVAVARGEASPDDEDLDEANAAEAMTDGYAGVPGDVTSEDAVTALEDGVSDESSDTVEIDASESADE